MTRLAELEVEEDGGIHVARLQGELDLSNVTDVSDALATTLPPGAHSLVIDLSGLRHLDSAGVRMLFDLRRLLGLRRQHLSLSVPADARIREVVDLAAVGATIPLFANTEDAIAAARAGDEPR